MKPPAVVMNMFYTGVGIARSLGEQGIPVIGLTAQKRIYGNYTRYAKVVSAPDSRTAPKELAAFLLKMGHDLESRAVIFPTRDDDLIFLDRYREQLEPFFSPVIPPRVALKSALDKWQTYQWSQRAGVASPKCWRIENAGDLHQVLNEVHYPCVLKPISASAWRQDKNWELVGGRKAIALSSPEELLEEYNTVSKVVPQALLQELIPGADNCLTIAACYMDRNSKFVAGFNTQKLLQIPEGFGTGCIVQAVDRPELFEPAVRLLETMGYSGIAEVEFKWNADANEYQLIEVNPRPWDQHRLGHTCGTDLAVLAYHEHAGLPYPAMQMRPAGTKWIAEDGFITEVFRCAWKRDPKIWSLFRLASGRRIYAIWSARDPLPFLAYMSLRFIPGLIANAARMVAKTLQSGLSRIIGSSEKTVDRGGKYEPGLEAKNRA